MIAGEWGGMHPQCFACAIILDCFVALAGQEHTEDLTTVVKSSGLNFLQKKTLQKGRGNRQGRSIWQGGDHHHSRGIRQYVDNWQAWGSSSGGKKQLSSGHD